MGIRDKLRRVWGVLSGVSTIITFVQVFGYWQAAATLLAGAAAVGAGVVEQLPIAVIVVMGWSTFAATVALFVSWNNARLLVDIQAPTSATDRQHREANDAWRDVDEFQLFQAACLWENIEPAYPVPPGPAYARFTMIKQAIRNGEINASGTLSDLMKIKQRMSGAVHAATLVARSELAGLAERKGLRPRFLFPMD